MKPSVGVIVGRFQVPELHDGHLELFRAVRGHHSRVVVFVGLSPTRNASKRHPLDFETRRRMIQAKFPDFCVLPLLDKRTDEEWSLDLDKEISKLLDFGDVRLYGSRDSFIPHYKGHRPVQELLLTEKCSGTEIRDSITNTVKESYDFRAGVIHTLQNRRPIAYTAVDIAILYRGVMPGFDGLNIFVLLGKKPGFDKWRFPGGYVDPQDSTFEQAARREAYEETNLDIPDLKYVASSRILDWRYSKEADQIFSVLYKGTSMTLGGTAGDDINTIRWFLLDHSLKQIMVPEHQFFYEQLLASEPK